jgi:glutamine synthetase
MASLEAYEEYGKGVFTGKVADEYLQKHGASGEILKDPSWVKTHADVVANAVFDW